MNKKQEFNIPPVPGPEGSKMMWALRLEAGDKGKLEDLRKHFKTTKSQVLRHLIRVCWEQYCNPEWSNQSKVKAR